VGPDVWDTHPPRQIQAAATLGAGVQMLPSCAWRQLAVLARFGVLRCVPRMGQARRACTDTPDNAPIVLGECASSTGTFRHSALGFSTSYRTVAALCM
jgi:hypothetical protein